MKEHFRHRIHDCDVNSYRWGRVYGLHDEGLCLSRPGTTHLSIGRAKDGYLLDESDRLDLPRTVERVNDFVRAAEQVIGERGGYAICQWHEGAGVIGDEIEFHARDGEEQVEIRAQGACARGQGARVVLATRKDVLRALVRDVRRCREQAFDEFFQEELARLQEGRWGPPPTKTLREQLRGARPRA